MGLVWMTASLLLSGPARAPVHGEGVLTADRGSMAAGESLKLTGASFAPREPYQLKLVGALQEFTLATVQTAADSTFSVTVKIPADAREGSYRIEAIADDGDVSAALDVTLLATAPVPNERSTAAMPGMENMPMARADEVPINRSRSGGEWAVIGLVIGLAAGFGLGMLTRRRLETAES